MTIGIRLDAGRRIFRVRMRRPVDRPIALRYEVIHAAIGRVLHSMWQADWSTSASLLQP